MEGVIDFPMRRLLTDLGGYDRCVTEFVRVTDVLLPERVFFRLCPELREGSVTRNGTPVFVQLLGGQPEPMAKNAVRAVEMGAAGIDLNFGCPAKTVNRSDGGSVLLRSPERVHHIVSAVRDAVDPAIEVHAKVRLGFENTDNFDEVAAGIESAGATALCIHARTRKQGYKPPAYWSRVAAFGQSCQGMRLTINGDIWTPTDANNALLDSRCAHLMFGRSALSCPDLALRVRAVREGRPDCPMQWSAVLDLVELQFSRSDKETPRYIGNRTKQWLAYLKRNYAGAQLLFDRIKRLHDTRDFIAAFDTHRRLDLDDVMMHGEVWKPAHSIHL